MGAAVWVQALSRARRLKSAQEAKGTTLLSEGASPRGFQLHLKTWISAGWGQLRVMVWQPGAAWRGCSGSQNVMLQQENLLPMCCSPPAQPGLCQLCPTPSPEPPAPHWALMQPPPRYTALNFAVPTEATCTRSRIQQCASWFLLLQLLVPGEHAGGMLAQRCVCSEKVL